MVFTLALYLKDTYTACPEPDEIERPDTFLKRIQYIIDYATAYYIIQFFFCFVAMPIWLYSSMVVWVGFDASVCLKGPVLMDFINMILLSVYASVYSLLTIPAIPLVLYFWKPLYDKLRSRLLNAFF